LHSGFPEVVTLSIKKKGGLFIEFPSGNKKFVEAIIHEASKIYTRKKL